MSCLRLNVNFFNWQQPIIDITNYNNRGLARPLSSGYFVLIPSDHASVRISCVANDNRSRRETGSCLNLKSTEVNSKRTELTIVRPGTVFILPETDLRDTCLLLLMSRERPFQILVSLNSYFFAPTLVVRWYYWIESFFNLHYNDFSITVVFLSFHSCLVSVPFTGPPSR